MYGTLRNIRNTREKLKYGRYGFAVPADVISRLHCNWNKRTSFIQVGEEFSPNWEKRRRIMFEMEFFKSRKILLTGHTGFKGTWMSLMLEKLGARYTAMRLKKARARRFSHRLQPKKLPAI